MENNIFVDDANIPLITCYDEDREKDNDYYTPNTSTVDESSFTMFDSTRTGQLKVK